MLHTHCSSLKDTCPLVAQKFQDGIPSMMCRQHRWRRAFVTCHRQSLLVDDAMACKVFNSRGSKQGPGTWLEQGLASKVKNWQPLMTYSTFCEKL